MEREGKQREGKYLGRFSSRSGRRRSASSEPMILGHIDPEEDSVKSKEMSFSSCLRVPASCIFPLIQQSYSLSKHFASISSSMLPHGLEFSHQQYDITLLTRYSMHIIRPPPKVVRRTLPALPFLAFSAVTRGELL